LLSLIEPEGGKAVGIECAATPFPARSSFGRGPLAFRRAPRHFARHANRDLHYRLDYLLLTPVGGAVFFIS